MVPPTVQGDSLPDRHLPAIIGNRSLSHPAATCLPASPLLTRQLRRRSRQRSGRRHVSPCLTVVDASAVLD